MISFSSSSTAVAAVVRNSGFSTRPFLPPQLQGGTVVRRRAAIAAVLMSTKEMSKLEDAVVSSTGEVEEKEEKKKTTLPVESAPSRLPEPPEKPLPGDCCGSGCVRCVWDVYYEELEEYNDRLLSVNGQKSVVEESGSN